MEGIIKRAVLHIMDTSLGVPIYSQEELPIDDDTVASYVFQQWKKIYHDDSCKNGMFQENSSVEESIRKIEKSEESFLEESVEIANVFYENLRKCDEVIPGDILIAKLMVDTVPFLLIVKLDYKEAYTHFIEYGEQGTANRIIVNRAVFPTGNQKNNEGAVIHLNDFSIRLIENKYMINGEKAFYFSERFLECITELSVRESIKVIKEVAKDVGKRYYGDDFEKVAHVKMALYDTMDEGGAVEIDHVAAVSFQGNPEVRKEYVDKVMAAGVSNRITIQGGDPEKRFGKQKIKTDQGIELTIPMGIYRNRDMVEFVNNPDGTISIILKNINQIMNK